MTRHRWMKFWPGDWQRDPALRVCSLAARGLWIECIALMHEATPYGHLLVGGRAPTPRQLALIVGAREKEIVSLLSELRSAGVLSETEEGIIYSRRMVRDAQISEEAREYGRKGGNPRLVGDKGGVNPPVKPTLKPEAEAEAERESESPPTPPSGGDPPAEQKPKGEGEEPRQKRGKPKVALPEGWKPDRAHVHYAKLLGLDPVAEFASFRDKAAAKAWRYADWDAFWRDYCWNQAKWAAEEAGRPAPARPTIEECRAATDPGNAEHPEVKRRIDALMAWRRRDETRVEFPDCMRDRGWRRMAVPPLLAALDDCVRATARRFNEPIPEFAREEVRANANG